MKHKSLEYSDIVKFKKDLFKAYMDNHLIMDCQNPYLIENPEDMVEFLKGYVEAPDSLVVGILDNKEAICYGYLIYDNIRIVDVKTAEVHIAIAKEIWGKIIRDLFKEMLNGCFFDILYAQVPQNACRAIGMLKHLGFKKTGYIPKALPYTNSKGETKLYDLNIFVHERGEV